MANTITPDMIVKGAWYPEMPPQFPGESEMDYTRRLIGAYGHDWQPYDHARYRHCAVGWHEDCSDPDGRGCQCPCHRS